MAAMLAANAIPALAQAVVVPKECLPYEDPIYSNEYCYHVTQTPSGNFNSHDTFTTERPEESRTHNNYHSNPGH